MSIKRLMRIGFVLTVFSLAPYSSQAVLGCDTITAGGRCRLDIVPCADEERDHLTASNSSAEATKQAKVLIAWIVAQTHWIEQEMPPIRIIPHSEIKNMFNTEATTGSNCEALYSSKNHTVYLADSWHSNDLRDRSILLHELVHHLQYLNHIKVTCESEYEFQAFKLQVAWLSEQGVEYPLDLMGVDLRYVMMLSHCPEF
jgi:Domain of unknown function (DUF6647)